MSDRTCACGEDFMLAYGLCEKCRRQKALLLGKILGLDGPTWDEHGVLVGWDEIDKLYASMTPIPYMHAKTLFRTLTAYDEVRTHG